MSNRQQEIFANVAYDRSKLAVSNGQALAEVIFHQAQFPESRNVIAYYTFDAGQPGIVVGNTYEVFPVRTEGELSPYVNQSTTSPLDLRDVSSPTRYVTAEVLTDAHRLGVRGAHPTQTGQANLVFSYTKVFPTSSRTGGTATQPVAITAGASAPAIFPFSVAGYMPVSVPLFNAVPTRTAQGGHTFVVQFVPTLGDVSNKGKVVLAVSGINTSANAPQ
jgi:hypothetical protein